MTQAGLEEVLCSQYTSPETPTGGSLLGPRLFPEAPGGLAGPWGPPEALTRLLLSLGMGASPCTPSHRQEQTASPESLPDSPGCPLVHREPLDLGVAVPILQMEKLTLANSLPCGACIVLFIFSNSKS